ncbi:heavy-metal-associated domain-containing protein [Roseateles sp.]|uniref:heavy-metal-associated domain-containing protein n=1 Tax=Roseateles sp. TaxID=1971397 RepID=UPI00286B4827|nr:heavy-metal-associated domain-containing protein [Roseateles sp.]
MLTFEVSDMTCGHCVGVITKAVQAVDPSAKLQFNLAAHQVQIESAQADAQKWSDAITAAGYTPLPLRADAAPVALDVPPRRSGCGSGCGCA